MVNISASTLEQPINIAWRPPFAFGESPRMSQMPYGSTIQEIVDSIPELPKAFQDYGYVCLGGVPVDRALWKSVRPKPEYVFGGATIPMFVTLHIAPQGGGDSGSTGKQIIGLVAAIALTIVTSGIAGGALATGGAGSWFAAGTMSAKVLAGAVALGGALLISALTPPPNATTNKSEENKGAASINGNTAEAGGPIPRVIGTHKIYPPFLTEPLIEIIDGDEFVEFVTGCNGPHMFADIRVSDSPIESADDVEYEVREGWDTDVPITLVTRQGKTQTPQIELSKHLLLTDSDVNLRHSSNPVSDCPVWHTFVARAFPDHIWTHITLPEGLYDRASSSAYCCIPFRMAIRPLGGTTWINLPEFHISSKASNLTRLSINLNFDIENEPLFVTATPSNKGFYYAHNAPPTGTVSGSPLPAWVADSYFTKAGTNDYVYTGQESVTKIAHTYLFESKIDFYLDPAIFTANVYEIQLKRGSIYKKSSFSLASYQYGGNVIDLFLYYLSGITPRVAQDASELADSVYVNRVISVWDEHPVPKPGFALIAGRAKNRSLTSVSTVASGYVRDYNAGTSSWDTWTTTSLPAPHYRDILAGRLNFDPLPDDLINDQDLITWRARNITDDHTCDMVIEDFRTAELLSTVASCGYARPYQSEKYGVIEDYDTSAESPIMIFSPRNSSNFSFDVAFAAQPNGWIIDYTSILENYEQKQEIVFAPDYENDTSINLESISYVGLVYTAKVRKRGLFDFAQVKYRPVFYSLNTNIDSIMCRRGDLVGVQHDVIDDYAGFGYVKSFVTNGSNQITSMTLDSEVRVVTGVDMHAVTDMHAVADMHNIGRRSGIAIQHTDGTITTHEVTAPTADYDGMLSTLTLVTPMSAPLSATVASFEATDYERASHVVSGAFSNEYLRVKVYAISPEQDFKATVTFVDEAPEIWQSI